MVTETSNVMDDAQWLSSDGLRSLRSPVLVALVGPVLLGLVVRIVFTPVAGLVFASLALAVSAAWVSSRTLARAHATAGRREQQVLLERAAVTASQALLKRNVADPVGTALGALIDSVDTEAVFLESISQQPVDEHGNTATVRDVLYRDDPDRRPGRWELNGWRLGPIAATELCAGREHETDISSLEGMTGTYYRAAEIGSEILHPITVEGKWIGSLGFFTRSRGRLWSPDERRLLRATAEMVGAYWERRDAVSKLEELLAAKDEFIASVSHEVRTPLTAVLGFAAELDENPDRFSTEERAEMISLLAIQSREVANIVDDLLTAARAEAGTIVIAPQAISMRDLIGEVLSSHSGRVEFSMQDDVDVWADGGRVRQILRNLLTNADRYGGEVVRVTVRAVAGPTVQLEVRDNGAGIPHHLREHIFEPYARGRNSATQPASVGLGLSVARQLAVMMNGSLVLSEEDGWTVFSLRLPAARLADLAPAGQ